MKEREQPSDHFRLPTHTSPIANNTHQETTLGNDPINNTKHLVGAGTYVVQVPKDQVFRVPQPENEKLVHQNPSEPDGRSRSSSSVCLCILMIIMIAGIFGVMIFLTQAGPEFHVEHVKFAKLPAPEFDIGIKVHNPNKFKEISYDQEDSIVSLMYKQKIIAEGKFPALDQDPKNTIIFNIVLHGSNFPQEIMNSTIAERTPLSLSMDIGVQFKLAGYITDNRIDVSCKFLVDRLNKDTQVLAQDCDTN